MKTPDEDWIKADLRAGYEYAFELWTPTDFPEQHQARDLKVLGIYGPDGALVPNTATQTSGPRVSLVFRPGTTGTHYLSVGPGETDPTGVYKVSVTPRDLP